MNNPTTFSLICTVVEKDLERRIAKLGDDGAILRFDGLRADCLTAIVSLRAPSQRTFGSKFLVLLLSKKTLKPHRL